MEEKTINALEAVNFDNTVPKPIEAPAYNSPITMNVQLLKEIVTIANYFSKTQLVADCYQGERGKANAFAALTLGFELNIAPFMALNHIVVIKGRPAIDGQLAISLMNQRAPIRGTIRYDEKGEGDKMECTAWCIDKETNERLEYKLTWADVKQAGWDRNMNWQKFPKLMSRYRSSSYLIRSHYPSVMMGLKTEDEVQDIVTTETKLTDSALRKEIGLKEVNKTQEVVSPK